MTFYHVSMTAAIAVLVFGLLVLQGDGRIIESLDPELREESGMKSNELIDQISGANLRDNLRGVEIRQRQGRLSEAEHSTYNLKEPNGPGTYAFGYDNVLDRKGNEHFRSEEKLQNGTIVGEYGYTDYEERKVVLVTYTADKRGYRAKTKVFSLDVTF